MSKLMGGVRVHVCAVGDRLHVAYAETLHQHVHCCSCTDWKGGRAAATYDGVTTAITNISRCLFSPDGREIMLAESNS